MAPEHHQFQLWAYATAIGRSTAHIAYLRHDYPHTFGSVDLAKIEATAHTLAQGIVSGQYPATPSLVSCKGCGYGEICEHQTIEEWAGDESLKSRSGASVPLSDVAELRSIDPALMAIVQQI